MDVEISSVNSVSQYIEQVVSVEEALENDRPLCKKELMFRGQGSTAYKLLPSIGRNRKSSIGISILNLERYLVEMARYRLPELFNRTMNPLEKQSLLQHYGISTRVLDITSNSLAALYFACVTDKDKVGDL